MNSLALSPNRLLNTGLALGAVIAALAAFAPQVQAGQSFDRPASYDVRDVRSSGPTGAVPTTRAAKTVAARDARCDIRDVCSESPPIAVTTSSGRADATARNPACDTRDVCTSTGTPLAKPDSAFHYVRAAAGATVTR
jgi:hypothetical protein